MCTSNLIALLARKPTLIFIYVIIQSTFLIYNRWSLISQNIDCCINN